MKSQKRGNYVFLIPLVTAVGSVSLLLLAIKLGWMGQPAGHGANFCEAPREGLIIQPVNTWSNLGFIFTGIYIGYLLSTGKYASNKNPLTKNSFYATFFATLTVLLGPGSMAMHATTTAVGGFLDMLSMYLVAAFITAYAVERLLGLSPLYFTLIFIAVVATCLYVQTLPYQVPVVGFIGSFVFALFIILTAIVESLNSFVKKLSHDLKWGILSMLTMMLAFFIWNLSLSTSPYCDPSSLVQGHGIWHLLNALSVYFLFRYYVSEHKE